MRFLIAFVLLVLVACAPAERAAPTPQVPQDIPETPYDEPESTAPDEKPNPEIQAIFARAGDVNSYSFQLANLPETSGSLKYYVRGDLAKIVPVQPIHMDGWSADAVFLDYTTKTAIAYCLELGQCKGDGRKDAVSFETYAVKLPPQWLDEIQYGVKTKALQFNNRPNTVVTWLEGSLLYEAYLDNYYGFPQRVAVVTGSGEDAEIISGYEYQSMTFNTVKETDVTPPY